MSETTETVKLVHRGTEVVIFEGGWWMDRSDYDKVFPENAISYPNPNFGMDRDEVTRKITLFLLP